MADHAVVVSQLEEGCQAACICGWEYKNTSPSIAQRAVELHIGAPLSFTFDAEELMTQAPVLPQKPLGMTVADLIAALETLEPTLRVILQKDAEGNGYSPATGAEIGYYAAESSWSGDVYSDGDADIPDDAEKVVVIWPIN